VETQRREYEALAERDILDVRQQLSTLHTELSASKQECKKYLELYEEEKR
jgi:hypothetical protein